MEELKDIIARNLVTYRKNAGLTQQEIADKLNYSDKAVSKWERGEGMPDVSVLKALADIYGITVNDFLIVPDSKPAKPNTKARKAKHWLVSMLSFGLVWFVATIAMAIGLIVDPTLPMVAEYAYIVALPVSMIVLVVFSCIWGRLWMQALSVSALVWTVCVFINVVLSPLLGISPKSWVIYLAGAALQLLVILWYLLRFFMKRTISIDNIHSKKSK